MHQLSFLDSVMLHDTPRTPNHVNMVGIYDPSTAPDGRPTFEQILSKIEACLPAAPAFRRKLVPVPLGLELPYWVEDENFDLEFHIRQLALPKPGDWRQFCVQVARLHSRPLDLTRPPWEMTVVEGLDNISGLPPGCFGTVLKVHHSAIDGVSGVELLNAIHDLSADSPPERMDDTWSPEPTPSASSLLRRAGIHAAINPAATAQLIAGNLAPLAREAARAVRNRGPAMKLTRTRFNVPVSAHRVFDEARCSLADMKRIKSAVPGATINDLCLSIVGGAMYSYLDALGEPPDEPLVSMVPISTRTPDQAATGGNQVSAMRVSMHTDLLDPLARLAAIHAETAAKKATQNGVAVPVLLDVARLLPGALIGAAMRGISALGSRAPVMANTVVTNVPGSPVPLYFLGAEMVRSTGCTPLFDGLGLFHCVSSYHGTVGFMITADRDLLPDAARYVEHLDRSIADHAAAADHALAAGDAKPQRRRAAKPRGAA